MDLTDALGIGAREVVALVGGGGKTTTMYRLCAEAAARGRHAIAAGTARFTEPAGGARVSLVIDEDEDRLVASVADRGGGPGWTIAATGRGSKGRLSPVTYDCVARLAAVPSVDLVVLEADGSAMRAFKAPADHEPPVPPSATLVVALAGADVFAKPLTEEVVHRPERVADLTGAKLGAVLTPEVVAGVLAHREGGRKCVPEGARFAVVINKVSGERLEPARATARLLATMGVPLVVLAQARLDPPVVEVWGA